MSINVARLAEYKDKLVVFPLEVEQAQKKGDTPASAAKEIGQSKADINALPRLTRCHRCCD